MESDYLAAQTSNEMAEEIDCELPHDIYRWNKAHRGAFIKGIKAFRAGQSLDDCPYQDIRKASGCLTRSRAFGGCWRDGWRWGRKLNTPKRVDGQD